MATQKVLLCPKQLTSHLEPQDYKEKFKETKKIQIGSTSTKTNLALKTAAKPKVGTEMYHIELITKPLDISKVN